MSGSSPICKNSTQEAEVPIVDAIPAAQTTRTPKTQESITLRCTHQEQLVAVYQAAQNTWTKELQNLHLPRGCHGPRGCVQVWNNQSKQYQPIQIPRKMSLVIQDS